MRPLVSFVFQLNTQYTLASPGNNIKDGDKACFRFLERERRERREKGKRKKGKGGGREGDREKRGEKERKERERGREERRGEKTGRREGRKREGYEEEEGRGEEKFINIPLAWVSGCVGRKGEGK